MNIFLNTIQYSRPENYVVTVKTYIFNNIFLWEILLKFFIYSSYSKSESIQLFTLYCNWKLFTYDKICIYMRIDYNKNKQMVVKLHRNMFL